MFEFWIFQWKVMNIRGLSGVTWRVGRILLILSLTRFLMNRNWNELFNSYPFILRFKLYWQTNFSIEQKYFQFSFRNFSYWNIITNINKQIVRKCPESDRVIDFVTTEMIDLHEVATEDKTEVSNNQTQWRRNRIFLCFHGVL